MSAVPYQYKSFDYRYDADFVFTGAGAAGLSLLMRMLQSGRFDDRTFLLVDRDRKQSNDRTWCFWETGAGHFDHLVFRSWENAWFHGPGFSRQYSIAPYRYKMIRGIDFYEYCFNYIRQCPNVRILFEPVARIENQASRAALVLQNGETYYAGSYLFNSILFDRQAVVTAPNSLLQHFRGWVIETEKPCFEPGTNTLMDFRVDQKHGTTFVYTMPFDRHNALVEYTLFSRATLPDEEYEKGLRAYISEYLQAGEYVIKEKEAGTIPMSSFRYPTGEGRIVQIGMAGGQTKPSSGYTFQFIQRHSEAILQRLLKKGEPWVKRQPAQRFRFYDNVLLNVLSGNNITGERVFTQLFRNNPAPRIFRFLDNQTWLGEELLLISSLPTMPFLRALKG